MSLLSSSRSKETRGGAQPETDKKGDDRLKKLDRDEGCGLYACTFQIAELLGEDARAAEGDEKRGGGQGSRSFGRQGGAAVRRFEKSRGKSRPEVFGERRKYFPEKQGERRDKFQICEHFCQYEKERDKSSDGQDGQDGAEDAFGEDAVGFFKGRQGRARFFFFTKPRNQKGNEHDRTKVRREEYETRRARAEHRGADASDEEHGARSRAQGGGEHGIPLFDESLIGKVGEEPAPDGIPR